MVDKISGQWTTHDTPPQKSIWKYIPISQTPAHSTACNDSSCGYSIPAPSSCNQPHKTCCRFNVGLNLEGWRALVAGIGQTVGVCSCALSSGVCGKGANGQVVEVQTAGKRSEWTGLGRQNTSTRKEWRVLECVLQYRLLGGGEYQPDVGRVCGSYKSAEGRTTSANPDFSHRNQG